MKKFFKKLILLIIDILIGVTIVLAIPRDITTHWYYDNLAGIISPSFEQLSDTVFSYKELTEYEKEIVLYLVDIYTGGAYLYKDDYYIIITDDELKTNVEYTRGKAIAALTSTTKKTITVRYDYLEYALPHELAHAVDATYGFSDSPEFTVLYEKAVAENTIHWYYLASPKEYFAYCYESYILDSLTDVEVIEYFDTILKQDNYT